ncbi:Ribosomal protein L11 methyltransferase, partial [Candidatus Arthromitus sp. SFB-1]
MLVDGKEICVVRYYISEKENVTEFLDIIKSMIRYENIDCFIETQEVLEEDWANNWKKYYHTFKIDNRVVIKPEWENYERLNDEILINIDPGMAFGTGTHETTKLCIQMMCKYMKDDYFVYDVGTGSGILGILAAKLNARKVIAIDLDKVSVSAAKYNVKLNNISNIEIIEGNLLDNMNEKGDIIVSNIIAEIICDLIPDVTKVLNEDGIFIISGIIDSKVNLIK